MTFIEELRQAIQNLQDGELVDSDRIDEMCSSLQENPEQLDPESARAVIDTMRSLEQLIRLKAQEIKEETGKINSTRRAMRGYGKLKSHALTPRLRRRA